MNAVTVHLRRLSPAQAVVCGLGALALALVVAYGVHDVAQRSMNGMVSASYFALGAIGLTLIYGTLKLVNFAHGDMLTLGAYVALVVNVTLGASLILAVLVAIAFVAALGAALELGLWRPMRRRRAGMLQLLLVAIGLAFVLRYGIQLFAGSDARSLDVNVTRSVEILGLRLGRTELVVIVVGFVVLLAVAAVLRYTRLGKMMRAIADDMGLAETAGIATNRVIVLTWMFAAGLAALAGVLYAASIGTMTPNLGFLLLLSLFASVLLGGIGNAFGALAGGLVLGLIQEWSTLLVDARWKQAIGFLVLILVLIVRPQGIFGGGRRL